MAVRATVAGDKLSALVQERCGSLFLQMALSAAGLDVLRGQQGLLPLLGGVVSFLHGGGSALSTMAGGAAKLRQRMRNDRVLAEGYGTHVGEGRFLQSEVTGAAAVGHLL